MARRRRPARDAHYSGWPSVCDGRDRNPALPRRGDGEARVATFGARRKRVVQPHLGHKLITIDRGWSHRNHRRQGFRCGALRLPVLGRHPGLEIRRRRCELRIPGTGHAGRSPRDLVEQRRQPDRTRSRHWPHPLQSCLGCLEMAQGFATGGAGRRPGLRVGRLRGGLPNHPSDHRRGRLQR